MIANLPLWVTLLFLGAFVYTLIIFHFSNGKAFKTTGFIVCWAVIQSIFAYMGFYQETMGFPPRLALILVPSILFIYIGVKNMHWVMVHRNIKVSTFLHVVRFAVEVVLFKLAHFKMVPILMTFEGRNYDILIGLTALLMGGLFLKWSGTKKLLLSWNIIGLFMVLFIFVNAAFSVVSPVQLFGFDQPNRAILYFPFILLPAVIVPIVVYTHITDILKLRREIVSAS